ncbi:hypothetical protein [Gemmatimonas sp.]|uniref:hypothetical protein n=1 Tax=Gemmatimonas sp. TaxID=1962908 RepID=UPI0022BE393C|nr:hypothetical protein [Gemmatimonas sp.]MCZ8205239.1 hypothetical protein [Gemmatimonas sp.]
MATEHIAPPAPALLTRRQVAEAAGVTSQHLANLAVLGRGPVITYVENRPRYALDEVNAWLAARRVSRRRRAELVAG